MNNDPEIDALLGKGHRIIRAMARYTGIAEVRSMQALNEADKVISIIPQVQHPITGEWHATKCKDSPDSPTADELRDRWSRMNMHEGGIEWDGPLPNWAPGLKVTEEPNNG